MQSKFWAQSIWAMFQCVNILHFYSIDDLKLSSLNSD